MVQYLQGSVSQGELLVQYLQGSVSQGELLVQSAIPAESTTSSVIFNTFPPTSTCPAKSSLKVLSSEMDLTKIRFIRKAFIKDRGAEVFREIQLSPIL